MSWICKVRRVIWSGLIYLFLGWMVYFSPGLMGNTGKYIPRCKGNTENHNVCIMTWAEFVNVTVSRSCDRAKLSRVCAKSWELYLQTKKLCNLNTFKKLFFYIIHTFHVILGVIFALFLAQNFKTEVLTAQKNLVLECLDLSRDICWNIDSAIRSSIGLRPQELPWAEDLFHCMSLPSSL